MKLEKPQLALVDLDGTMVDSVPDLARCANAALISVGLSERSESDYRQWVGNGVERLVERALMNRLDGEPDPDLRSRAMPVFMDWYGKHGFEQSRLYPGVTDGLDYLLGQGVRLGCVTNKAERFTLPILDHLGLRRFFDLVISGDTLPEKKPSPRPLQYACEYFKVPPSRSLMIGDSRTDVTAARAAGFTCVCVSYGYNHGQDIRCEQPDYVVDSLAELANLLHSGASEA